MDAQRSGDKLFASGAVDHLEIEFEFSSLTFWQGLIFLSIPVARTSVSCKPRPGSHSMGPRFEVQGTLAAEAPPVFRAGIIQYSKASDYF
jgi:hypothetical protein